MTTETIKIEFPLGYVGHLLELIYRDKAYPANFKDIIHHLNKSGHLREINFKLAIKAVELDDVSFLNEIEAGGANFGEKEIEELIKIARHHKSNKILDFFQDYD